MVCSSYLRNAIIQAGSIGTICRRSLWSGSVTRVLHDSLGPTYPWNHERRKFRASVKMMVDTGATENRRTIVDVLPEKEDDGGYVSGGCKSEDGKLSCGYSSFRGKRASMEDFYDVKMSEINGKTVCLFGIFDGHGGSRAAQYLKQHLFENLIKHPQFMMDTKLAISETYKQTDMDFLDAEKDTFRDDGSTASTAVLVGNHLYVANVGDSRTVISKAGKAIALSEDHKPNRLDERKRIESAGGVVMWAGTWRVGGVLAMSRAFGNRMLKQFVVAEPEIQEQEINEELELLVLASDGLWDVVPNEDAVSIARVEEEPEGAARKLTETAFTRGSADNITCIVVKFHHEKAEPIEPQLEQQKEAELNQSQTKDDELREETSKESDLLQGEIKEAEARHDQIKEAEARHDQIKEAEAQLNQIMEAELRHDLEGSLAHLPGGGSLTST